MTDLSLFKLAADHPCGCRASAEHDLIKAFFESKARVWDEPHKLTGNQGTMDNHE